MRRSTGVVGLIAALALLFLAVSPAYADPPGNNGDVKIHEGAGESNPMEANDPHVCTFHIHGFNFDGSASGTWRIEGWPPTGGGTYNGTWGPADASGNWREPKAGAMTLPAGHYKLFVWQKLPNDPPGGPKQKVFWVDCGAQAGNGSGQAEKVRSELQAAINNAVTVKGELATEMGVTAQILATANLTPAQRAAIEAALAAATVAQNALTAAITAANSTLTQLVTAINSGSQINAAINAAVQAIANLNLTAGTAASANASLASAITANTSPAAQAQAQLANAISTANGVGTTLAGTIATAQGLNASGQLNLAGQAALAAALVAQTTLANTLTAAENALTQLTAAINSNVGVAAAVAAAATAQSNLGAAVSGAVTANANLSAGISASSPTTTTTTGTTSTGTTTTAGSTNTESVTTAGMTGSSVVAGFETSPQISAGSQGAATRTQGQSQAVAGIQNLPSTSTSQGTNPLALLGAILMAVGGAFLRRPKEQPAG